MTKSIFNDTTYRALRSLQTDLESVQGSFCLKVVGHGDNKHVVVVEGRFLSWLASVASKLGFKRYDLCEIGNVVAKQYEHLENVPRADLSKFSSRKLTDTCKRVSSCFIHCIDDKPLKCRNKSIDEKSWKDLKQKISGVVQNLEAPQEQTSKKLSINPNADIKPMALSKQIGQTDLEAFLQKNKIQIAQLFGADFAEEFKGIGGNADQLAHLKERVSLYIKRLCGTSESPGELEQLKKVGGGIWRASRIQTKGTIEEASYYLVTAAIITFNAEKASLADFEKILPKFVAAQSLLDVNGVKKSSLPQMIKQKALLLLDLEAAAQKKGDRELKGRIAQLSPYTVSKMELTDLVDQVRKLNSEWLDGCETKLEDIAEDPIAAVAEIAQERVLSADEKEAYLNKTVELCKPLFSQHLDIDIDALLEKCKDVDSKLRVLANVLLDDENEAKFIKFMKYGPEAAVKGTVAGVPYPIPENSLAYAFYESMSNNLYGHQALQSGGSLQERLEMLQDFALYLNEAHMLCYGCLDNYGSVFDQAQGKRALLLLELRSYLEKAGLKESALWTKLAGDDLMFGAKNRLFSSERLLGVKTKEIKLIFDLIPKNNRTASFDEEWEQHFNDLIKFEEKISSEVLQTPKNAGYLERSIYESARKKIQQGESVREGRYLLDLGHKDEAVKKQAERAEVLLLLNQLLVAAEEHMSAHQDPRAEKLFAQVREAIASIRQELYGDKGRNEGFSEKRFSSISKEELADLTNECLEILRPLQNSRLDRSIRWTEFVKYKREISRKVQ